MNRQEMETTILTLDQTIDNLVSLSTEYVNSNQSECAQTTVQLTTWLEKLREYQAKEDMEDSEPIISGVFEKQE